MVSLQTVSEVVYYCQTTLLTGEGGLAAAPCAAFQARRFLQNATKASQQIACQEISQKIDANRCRVPWLQQLPAQAAMLAGIDAGYPVAEKHMVGWSIHPTRY